MKPEKMPGLLRIDKKHVERKERECKLFEINQAYKNHSIFINKMKYGGVKNLTDIKGKKDKPVLLVGSGISLNEDIKEMYFWHNDIICSTSQFSTLVYHEIEPTFVGAIDPYFNDCELAIEIWKNKKYNFVLPVTFDNRAINRLVELDQQIYTYFRVEDGKEYLTDIEIGYSDISGKGHHYLQACPIITREIKAKVHAMVLQIKLAEMLCYNPIIIIGADCVIDRSDMYYYENYQWKHIKHTREDRGHFHNKDTDCKGISTIYEYKGKTTTNLLYDTKCEIDKAIKECRKKVIDCSGGIIEEGEKSTMKKMVDKYK